MAEESSPAATPDPKDLTETSAPPLDATPGKDAEASSSEAKAETKETLLEAVTKAVTEEAPADETSPSSDSAKTGTQAKDGDRGRPDFSQDPSPEELAGYKKDTRERIERLLGERNSFRAEADVTRVLRQYLVTHDISREDFQLTLDLAAAMRRGDFKAFLEGVGPYVQLATQALGITLPPDLAGEVQQGRMNFDAAAQVSRERYSRALAEQQATRATQVLTSQQETYQTTQLQKGIEGAVQNWENGVRATDPDYARKEETVRNFLWAVVRERGAPASPEQAVQIAQEAYARANRTVQAFRPPPRATRQVPSSINRTAPNARAEPKSMMEAALLGLERANGRA